MSSHDKGLVKEKQCDQPEGKGQAGRALWIFWGKLVDYVSLLL